MTAGASTTIVLSGMSGTFGDPDGDTLTYSAQSSDTSVVTADVNGSTLTLEAISAGSETVTVTAWTGLPTSCSYSTPSR